MNFINQVATSFLKNFITITEPVFLKEFTKESRQLEDLISLSNKLNDGDKKELIESDIIYLKAGISGESKVYYEIKNSFIPLICLHDIRIEYKDYVAQYDFIVITNKYICVLEAKKLYGNITINSDGDFIRVMKRKNGSAYKEGMYSPVSQNERHVNILKEMLLSNNIIKHTPIKSLVVMANDKTIIDKKECPEYVSKAIYRYDKIASYLKDNLNDKDNNLDISGKNMAKIARFILENDKPIRFDIISKYGITDDDYLKQNDENGNDIKQKDNRVNIADSDEIRTRLKDYRLKKSREENVKAFYIFNNKQMEDLIDKRPKDMNDILAINGFGEIKVGKYGKDILDIFNP